MSNSVDQRVVQMEFDNAKFDQNVTNTIQSLEKLDRQITLTGGNTSLSGMSESLKKIGGTLTQTIGGAAQKGLSFLGTTAANALGNIVSKAQAATQAIKFGLGGAIATVGGLALHGGIKRALNLEHANFQLQGLLKSETRVKKVMEDVDKSVQGTAYGLDEAAVVASQLAASNVKASKEGGEMYTVLRAVAGVAAMGGAEYSRVGQIFTTVAGQGRMMGDQLLQMSSMGLNAAATLADYLTKTGDGAKVTEEEVRDMVSKGKIDFETFAKAMDDAFGEHATKANETFTGAMSNVKAALSRIGAEFAMPTLENLRRVFVTLIPVINTVKKAMAPLVDQFKRITGNWTKDFEKMFDPWFDIDKKGNTTLNYLDSMTEKFRNLSRYIAVAQPVLDGIAKTVGQSLVVALGPFARAFDSVFGSPNLGALASFQSHFTAFGNAVKAAVSYLGSMGGAVNEGLVGLVRNAFPGLVHVGEQVGRVLSGIGFAFNGIFSWMELLKSQAIPNIGTEFTNFVTSLNIDNSTVTRIAVTFAHIFSIMKEIGAIAGGAVQGVWEALKGLIEMLGMVEPGIGSGLLDFFGSIRSFLESANNGEFLTEVGKSIGDFFRAIGSGEDLGGPLGAIINFFSQISEMAKQSSLLEALGKSFEKMKTSILGGPKDTEYSMALTERISSVLHSIADFGKDLPQKIADMFHNMNEEFHKLSETMGLTTEDLAGMFNVLTVSLSALISGNILYDAGMKIYTFVNNFLEAGFKLSNFGLDNRLRSAFWQIRDAFEQLAIAIKVTNVMKIAMAIAILVGAIYLLSTLESGQITAGLGSIYVMMVMLTRTMQAIGAIQTEQAFFGMSTVAAQFKALAVAVIAMAVAAKIFSSMEPDALARGLLSIALTMTILTGAMERIGPLKGSLFGSAAAIQSLAWALLLLAGVTAIFGHMKPETLAKGLGSIGVTMTMLCIAIKSFGKLGPEVALGAASFMTLSQSLLLLAISMRLIGSMSFEQLAVALVGLGGALAMLVGVLYLLDGAKLSSASAGLMLAAQSILVLAPALLMLSSMSWEGLAIALVAVGGSLLIFGAAAILLEGAIPAMMSTATALLSLGGAIALIGVGIALLASGFAVLATVGVGGLNTLVMGIQALVTTILTMLPSITTAVSTALASMVVIILNKMPAVIEAFVNATSSLLSGLATLGPQLMATGVALITSLLSGIQIVAPQLMATGVTLILTLAMGIVTALPALAEIGSLGMITFINTLANQIRAHHNEMYEAGKNLFMAILEALGDIFNNIQSDIGSFIMDIPAYISGEKQLFADAGTDLGQSTADSAQQSLQELPGIAEEGVNDMFSTMESAIPDTSGMFDGLTASVQESFDGLDFTAMGEGKMDELVTSLSDTSGVQSAGTSIGDSLVSGFDSSATSMKDKASSRAGDAVSAVRAKGGSANSAGSGVGDNFGSGIYGGMGSWIGPIADRAASMVSNAKARANAEMNAASPAKDLIKSGQWFGQGFEIGIRNMIPQVSRTAGAMVNEAKKSFSFQTFSDMLDAIDWDEQPTIRPVLDLSDYEAGISRMRTLNASAPMNAAQWANRLSPTETTGGYYNSRSNSISINLNYGAGTSAADMVNEMANILQTKTLMEA